MVDPIRVGQGFDVHALVPGRRLVLGGVSIEHEQGLLGHSDADVLLHAITDALLGAAALGDIGRLDSDSDPRYHGADSRAVPFGRKNGDSWWHGFTADRTSIGAPLMSSTIPALADRRVDEPGLDRLHALATAVLNEHTNDRGWCAACPPGVPFPCSSAVTAEHNAALR